MLHKIMIYLFLFLLFLKLSSITYAQDFTNDYQVEYFLTQDKDVINTRVNFSIKITNLRSDLYVSKFSISFSKTFIIHDLQAFDDNGQITPKTLTDETHTKIELEFSKPRTGRDSVNSFILQFNQENLFKINGNVWEVILPTIESRENGSYKIIVNLPANSIKKLSISKPKPDFISGNQIVWNNPTTKTIYAVFGDSQLYQLELNYHLVNSQLLPVYTDIALPPDTQFQKIYMQSINPKPISVLSDIDGNYLARYILRPAETKIITFNGVTEIFSKPRTDVSNIINSRLNDQKNYLLSPQKYWQMTNVDKIAGLNSTYDIFRFATDTLKYNYKKVNSKNERLGADKALTTSGQAVCMEFTDLFIAAAREKGVYAREIEGYGFSQNPQLRPLSLASDILHSWPEYYDTKSNLWTPVDPTWENTSGIDYFSSFDLNHIVFAIHGKRPDYPLPAGMYKTENSHDVLVKAITTKPEEIVNLSLHPLSLPKTITDNQTYKTKVLIENKGNVYRWNIPVEFRSNNLKFSQDHTTILSLAPLEKTEVALNFQSATKNKTTTGELAVLIMGQTVYHATVSVIPYYYDIAIKIALIVVGVSSILIIIKLVRRRVLAK